MKTIIHAVLCAAAMPLALLVTVGNGLAQSKLPISKLGPGQTAEVVGPALTVVSTVHYQAFIELVCQPNGCSGPFRKVGRNRRLNITRMSCYVSTNPPTKAAGYIQLANDTASNPLLQFLPVDDFDADSGTNLFNSAVDMQVPSGWHLSVQFNVATGTPNQALCTATGTLSRFK
jgi:hypothetical protein